MLAISKFCQHFAKIGNYAKTFKILPGTSKFCHFFAFWQNFAGLATLLLDCLGSCQIGPKLLVFWETSSFHTKKPCVSWFFWFTLSFMYLSLKTELYYIKITLHWQVQSFLWQNFNTFYAIWQVAILPFMRRWRPFAWNQIGWEIHFPKKMIWKFFRKRFFKICILANSVCYF